MTRKKKLLFVCSANVDRSPTAEDIFQASHLYEADSAGTFPVAMKQVTQPLIDSADIIFVMSERADGHLSFLKERFNLSGKEVYDLDIPDKYERDDPALIALLKQRVGAHI